MSALVEITLTDEQQEGTESVISQWFKKPGDYVKQHEPLCEVATDKVNVEVSAPVAGVLTRILKNPKDQVNPGEVLGLIDQNATAGASQTATAPAQAASAPKAVAQTGSASTNTDLSPAVKKLLKEHGLSAEMISGSGKDGRITHQDVMNHVAQKSAAKPASTAPSAGGPSRKIPHSGMRKSIADHMVQSLLHTAPHVTSVFQADLSSVIADREKKKKEFEAKGARLTFTAYFVQATVAALKAVPTVNSAFHQNELEVFEDFNIGIATAIEGKEDSGLIVPVLRKAQNLDLFATAKALQDLTTKARDNALTPQEVRGGTFTISNHGVSGSLLATPIIINQPQSAILGIGKLEKRALVKEVNGKDTIEIAPMVYITLTIDHRVLDGFSANKFLTHFVEKLEGAW